MELNKIEALLEAYFEGNTTLEEENVLRIYFSGEDIAPHLEIYIPIFKSFISAKNETSLRTPELPKSRFYFNYKLAATVAVFIGLGVFYFSQPRLSTEEKEALEAFEKSKESMVFLSQKFNAGTQQLRYIEEFNETKNKIFEFENE